MSKLPQSPHSLSISKALEELKIQTNGLTTSQSEKQLKEHGPNLLPSEPPPTLLEIFLHQFLNPLIYILGIAATISVLLQDYSDAIFIGLVLLINAIIGTIQEFSAEKSSQALKKMTNAMALVIRDGQTCEVNTESIVPGDIVLLESGRKVPADLRLISSQGLEVDESLLTGESLPISKNHDEVLPVETPLADRQNMAFTGSLVTKGRAKGVVVATGLYTELGKIASSITYSTSAKPPLVIRMELFTKKIAIFLLLVTFVMAAYLLLKGQSWQDVMMFSVALAVSAIPEGLPVSLTIALAIASRKMAKRNVIVRKLPAVEALGSCSYIATDKTGTLTVNQQTVRKLVFPEGLEAQVSGSGMDLSGRITFDHFDSNITPSPITQSPPDKNKNELASHQLLSSVACAGLLCNEAQIVQKQNELVGQGDAVDIALLVLAYKCHEIKKCMDHPMEVSNKFQLTSSVPFEPENQYAATLHTNKNESVISIKGAVEKLLPLCKNMNTTEGLKEIDTEKILNQAHKLASEGFRVLAIANKIESVNPHTNIENQLCDLNFLGLIGMIDPLRPEAAEAVRLCQQAGIKVAMVTGDHPVTALAIAKEIGLAEDMSTLVSGPNLKTVKDEQEKSALIAKSRVFARVEPQQKLEIVNSLISNGEFVAVTGDGANDAPALKSANVGVAMGKSGTDIAKETSDLIITDDRFASIVAGVEEGRIAYSNVRKVIYLLISTGAAEVVLFSLSLLFNTPLPLTAVQVLWLNLVTNGIQDKGLTFEPGEGDELNRPPRKPNEPIFDRLMLERIGLSALVMGGVSFIYFQKLIDAGVSIEAARNLTLLLLVLFENVMVGNCRSETKSAFKLNPFKNPILLFGTLFAQLIHIAALYTPGIRNILGVHPVSINEWLQLLALSFSVLVVIEVYKRIRFLKFTSTS